MKLTEIRQMLDEDQSDNNTELVINDCLLESAIEGVDDDALKILKMVGEAAALCMVNVEDAMNKDRRRQLGEYENRLKAEYVNYLNEKYDTELDTYGIIIRDGKVVEIQYRGEIGILNEMMEDPLMLFVTTLDLDGNRIGTEGARVLAASENLSRLECLDLRFNEIGAEARKYMMEWCGQNGISLWI